MSSQARKPYLGLKDSLIAFFEKPTRYIKESNLKESVFEKPYWDGEYPSMHLTPNVPDWPGPPKRPPRKGGGNPVPVLGCPGCALYADPTFDCEHDPVEIHAGIYCTSTPYAPTDRILTGESKEHTINSNGWESTTKTHPAYGVGAGDCTLEVYAEVGAIKQVTTGAWVFLGPSAAVYVDPNISEHTICGKMIDGAGSECIACADVSCCGCDNPPSAFALASYDSTIAPGGTAFVTVTGGCGPYGFSVGGALGYIVVGSGATGIVTSASGTCGVNYAAKVIVTATDVCGTSITCAIRNTGGGWSEQCTYGTAGCGYDDPAGCIGCGESEHWVYGTGSNGDKAWKAFSYACRDAGCTWSGGSCASLGAPLPPGECSSPYT